MDNNTIYDTAEVVLLASGPSYGLNLEKRVTIIDSKPMGEGDNLLNPLETNDPEEILAMFTDGNVSDEQMNLYDGSLPTFIRTGEITYSTEKYILDFITFMDPEESLKISTPAQLNSLVRDGNYVWSITVFDYDHSSKNHKGDGIFDISVRKKTSEEGETNTLYDVVSSLTSEFSCAGVLIFRLSSGSMKVIKSSIYFSVE